MAKKKGYSISRSVMAISLLISLVIILILMMGQLQKKQTTQSEASEASTGEINSSCRTYRQHHRVRAFRGGRPCGYRYLDYTCNGDPNQLNRTIGSPSSCRSRQQWSRQAEEFCKNTFRAPDIVCTPIPADNKLIPDRGSKPEVVAP